MMRALPSPFTRRSQCAFAVLLPHVCRGFCQRLSIQHHFHHADVLFPRLGIGLLFNGRVKDVIHGKSQRDSRQWACVRGVALGHGLGVNAGSVHIGCTQDDEDVILVVLVSSFFGALLILQVHCACRGSNKTFGCGKDDFGIAPLKGLGHGQAGDAIPFAYQNKLFSCNTTHTFSFLLQ
ncbi:hypothetical protein KL86DES1_20587 [uncultured Desulfovibrio sp.]|uniref:Uncharacterized protein n=1 Tax=uncultured Desulfovibrio sp. TaxID=167968 RepID=A0A212L4A7_9BACT|nr:hypothetical protein KL86DES1_20587 [uncultured Desulfovibrio sp.]VZH33490.1 conserved protein of unknown function [Desulfovibrio sp. 86]